ncbi:MAG: ATP-binding protein [Gammaproteobacteria bacterium]
MDDIAEDYQGSLLTKKRAGVSLRHKVVFGFASLVLLMTLSIGITLVNVSTVEKSAVDVIDHNQPAVLTLLDITEQINLATTFLNGYLLTGHADHKTDYFRTEKRITGKLTELNTIVNTGHLDIGHNSLRLIETDFNKFRDYARMLFELREDNNKNYPGLQRAADDLNPLNLEYMGLINGIIDSEENVEPSKKHQEVLSLLYGLRYSWVQMINSLRIFFNTRTDRDLENLETYWEINKENFNRLRSLDVEIGSDITFDGIGELDDISTRYKKGLPAVIKIFQNDAWRSDAYIMKTEVRPLVEELRELLRTIATKQVHASEENGRALTASLGQIRLYTVSLLIFGLVIGGILSFILTKSIIPPIKRLMVAAQRIANGDLSTVVKVESNDEIGQLSNSFNTMVTNLSNAENEKQRYFDELKILNVELEDRVTRRTAELERSEARISTVLASVGEGIITLDDKGHIESLNPAAENIFLLSQSEAVGKRCAYLLHGNEAGIPSESDHPAENIGKRSDGTTFPMELVVTKMHGDDQQKRVCVVRDITLRKQAEESLLEAQKQIVDSAHKSGMAEMATGVLHNIGNILNSVNLCGDEMKSIIRASKIGSLLKANELLKEHIDDIGHFLTEDKKGKVLPDYYLKLGKFLEEDLRKMDKEVTSLNEKTIMMKDVIRTQQEYAGAGCHDEELEITSLIEDAILVQKASIDKWGVKITKEYQATPKCMAQKSKLLQVITNIIKNAKEALKDNDDYNKSKTLLIETGISDDNKVYIKFTDNGCGIEEEHLSRIFNHGFTLKEDGHGFGLHTSANAMTEMSGAITVTSEGAQKGTCFTVLIPAVKASSEDSSEEVTQPKLRAVAD